MFIFFKRVNKTYKPKKKNSYVSIMTTDSMGAEKYNTDMSFSKSTRNNSQHTFSTSPGSDNFIVSHIDIKKSYSLNEEESNE